MTIIQARGSVVKQRGVADASIMPVITRANTNIPTVVIGEKIAGMLAAAS